MRKLAKLLLLLVLLAAGAWGYLWYQVKRSADHLAAQVAPFAKLEYGSVYVSPLGDQVGLNELVIQPQMTGDQISIEALRLAAPNALFFLGAEKKVEQGKFPERLGFSLTGLHMALDGPLFQMLGQMQQAAGEGQGGGATPLDRLEALACGSREAFTIADLVRAGVTEITLDLSFDINYDDATRLAQVAMALTGRDLYSLKLHTQLDGPLEQFAAGPTAIPKMEIGYQDLGWYKRRNSFCARQNESTAEVYVEQNLALLGSQLGGELPENVATAYRTFLLKGGRVDLSVTPTSTITPDSIAYYQPAELVQALGLQLKINNTSIALNDIAWHTEGEAPLAGLVSNEAGSLLGEVMAEAAKSEGGEAPAPDAAGSSEFDDRLPPSWRITPEEWRARQDTNRPRRSRFQPLAFASVEEALHKRIRVFSHDGRVREGRLAAVAGDAIQISLARHGGSLTFWVNANDINRLEVYQ